MDESNPPILFSYGGVQGGPRIEVSLSPDEMTAWGTFYPSTTPSGHLLVWSEFHDALTAAGIVEGILERELQEVLFQFNTGHPASVRITVARGRAPQAERPAFLKLEPKFYQHHFQDHGGVSINFKEYSPFVIAKKGELLARAVLPRPGVPGVTVRGGEVPSGRKEVKHLRPGPHTLFAHGKVFARVAGRFTLEGDVFDVADTLELDAGVGYTTGNLVFPGSITIKGVVADGFRLAAGGAITVKGPLDASEVLCQGDLTVEGGIIGKKPGVVRVGGSLKSSYMENCHVEVLGHVQVGRALLRVHLFTNSDFDMDEGSRVVASTIWVRGRLTCAQLGAENGAAKVVAGSDFVVKRRMDAIRSHYEQLEAEIDRDRSLGAADNAQKLEALGKLVDDMNALTAQLFINPQTEIRVTHGVQDGTVIEIGYASLTVTHPLPATVFRLASDGKSIVSSPWEKGA